MARLLQIAKSTLLSGGILGGGNWMGYISNATRQAIGMGLAELSEGQVHYFSKHHDLLKRAAIQIVSQTAYGLLRSYPRYLQYWEQRVRDKYLETQSQSSLANKTGQYYKLISEQQAVAQKKNYTDAYFKQVDWSGLQPTSVVILRPLPIEELTIKDATLTLDSLQMVTGIYSLNLSGLTCGNLKPLVECRELMTLNLTDARIKPTVLDEWLIAMVERYGNRRNCEVSLTAIPTGTYQEPARNADTGRYTITSGMEAIWVITHEESWNEGGKWKFIINDKEYSV